MSKESISADLEIAAKSTFVRVTGLKDRVNLQPLYLQPDRAVFLAEHAHVVLKVYTQVSVLQYEYENAQKAASIGIPLPEMLAFEAGPPAVLMMRHVSGQSLSSRHPEAAREAGAYLQRYHALGAQPLFSGGQRRWEAFIDWWAHREIENARRLRIFDHPRMDALQTQFDRLQPLLAQRPIVLLHGDLQRDHILIDPQTEQVLAFLDFADAQPGDPLLDIAVLTLWDHELADFILARYGGIENNEETQQLLTHYRLLRHLGEIPWLLERGLVELAERNRIALQAY